MKAAENLLYATSEKGKEKKKKLRHRHPFEKLTAKQQRGPVLNFCFEEQEGARKDKGYDSKTKADPQNNTPPRKER